MVSEAEWCLCRNLPVDATEYGRPTSFPAKRIGQRNCISELGKADGTSFPLASLVKVMAPALGVPVEFARLGSPSSDDSELFVPILDAIAATRSYSGLATVCFGSIVIG